MAGHHDPFGECECCGWETDDLREVDCYARSGPGVGAFSPDEEKTWAWMCKVCDSTMAGTAYAYAWSEDRGVSVLKTIAWQTNYLAAVIRGQEP